jgi:hypothetical protein
MEGLKLRKAEVQDEAAASREDWLSKVPVHSFTAAWVVDMDRRVVEAEEVGSRTKALTVMGLEDVPAATSDLITSVPWMPVAPRTSTFVGVADMVSVGSKTSV